MESSSRASARLSGSQGHSVQPEDSNIPEPQGMSGHRRTLRASGATRKQAKARLAQFSDFSKQSTQEYNKVQRGLDSFTGFYSTKENNKRDGTLLKNYKVVESYGSHHGPWTKESYREHKREEGIISGTIKEDDPVNETPLKNSEKEEIEFDAKLREVLGEDAEGIARAKDHFKAHKQLYGFKNGRTIVNKKKDSLKEKINHISGLRDFAQEFSFAAYKWVGLVKHIRTMLSPAAVTTATEADQLISTGLNATGSASLGLSSLAGFMFLPAQIKDTVGKIKKFVQIKERRDNAKEFINSFKEGLNKGENQHGLKKEYSLNDSIILAAADHIKNNHDVWDAGINAVNEVQALTANIISTSCATVAAASTAGVVTAEIAPFALAGAATTSAASLGTTVGFTAFKKGRSMIKSYNKKLWNNAAADNPKVLKRAKNRALGEIKKQIRGDLKNKGSRPVDELEGLQGEPLVVLLTDDSGNIKNMKMAVALLSKTEGYSKMSNKEIKKFIKTFPATVTKDLESVNLVDRFKAKDGENLMVSDTAINLLALTKIGSYAETRDQAEREAFKKIRMNPSPLGFKNKYSKACQHARRDFKLQIEEECPGLSSGEVRDKLSGMQEEIEARAEDIVKIERVKRDINYMADTLYDQMLGEQDGYLSRSDPYATVDKEKPTYKILNHFIGEKTLKRGKFSDTERFETRYQMIVDCADEKVAKDLLKTYIKAATK